MQVQLQKGAEADQMGLPCDPPTLPQAPLTCASPVCGCFWWAPAGLGRTGWEQICLHHGVLTPPATANVTAYLQTLTTSWGILAALSCPLWDMNARVKCSWSTGHWAVKLLSHYDGLGTWTRLPTSCPVTGIVVKWFNCLVFQLLHFHTWIMETFSSLPSTLDSFLWGSSEKWCASIS